MNLTDLQAFTARAAAEGQAMCPAIVLIGGTEYTATVPEPGVVGDFILGGETMSGTLVVRILIDDLAEAPALHQDLQWKRPAEVTWRATTYTIDEAKRHPMDSEWRIVCSPKN